MNTQHSCQIRHTCGIVPFQIWKGIIRFGNSSKSGIFLRLITTYFAHGMFTWFYFILCHFIFIFIYCQVLRVLMWILGISALIGNIFVIVFRLKSSKNPNHGKSNVESILVSNLAVSDLLMGVYMVIIASADMYYRDVYMFYAGHWQRHFGCALTGFLAVMSSEASVFFLTVLSIDRFLCIVFPFGQVRLRNTSAKVTVLAIWVTAFCLSVLPLVADTLFGDAFYGKSSVCLGLPLTSEKVKGWEYSVVLFLGVNCACFLIMTFCYSSIYVRVKSSANKMKSGNSSDQIKLATRMAFLVATDKFCWVPVIVMGALAQVSTYVQ